MNLPDCRPCRQTVSVKLRALSLVRDALRDLLQAKEYLRATALSLCQEAKELELYLLLKKAEPCQNISRILQASFLHNLTIYFSKPQSSLSFRYFPIQIHSFKARRLRLFMWPLLIVGRVIVDMRPASAASEAIEPEVSLKVWDVLHGTL